MSFVPGQQRPFGRANVSRTILFWVLMIALAVVLWQMASAKKSEPAAPEMSYSDFMTQVDQNNVNSAHLSESPSTAEIQGQLRQPPEAFRVTIPKETIPQLTEKLRKQGAVVEVSEMHAYNWKDRVLNWGIVVGLIGLWIFSMSRLGRNRQAAPPSNAPNRPIG
jgi:cell division protease FtsH